MTDLPVRVYSPEPLLGHPAKLVGTIAKDIWAGRELAWRLFIRDLSSQYRQSFLGYIWAFLPPLTASITFFSEFFRNCKYRGNRNILCSICHDGNFVMASFC